MALVWRLHHCLADGTTYHRFGGRDQGDASARMSIVGLVKLLKDSLADHAAYGKDPKPPEVLEKRVVEKLPLYANKRTGCFHCHNVNDAERDLAQREKRWSQDEIFRIPLPERIGLALDRDDPTRVVSVAKGSAAEKEAEAPPPE